ncbi:MAG TPA: acetyl-CoA carboxylase biotin carboxyl carrier protein [Caulobacteraceae bacterium]|jgi:acetyl-CoA carboxylase biotin carboxyl carrier protein|nr:acetyl-CoA carboxylase biotin carboxyl carrier protein [Caulobacteraceae bacterium]
MANSEDDAHPAESSVDARLVRELADLLNETGLTEIEVERGNLRVRLTKSLPPAPIAMAPPMVAAPPAYATVAPAAAPPAAAAAPSIPAGEVVKSPMVGTVYMQPQPGAPPFVRVGERVDEGQTLLLLEAMKTMNPIPAPKSGVLVEFMVADGQPVEYGEPLLVIG